MKSRYIIVLFLIACLGIWGAYYLAKSHPEETEKTITRAKTVYPKNQTEEVEEEQEEVEFDITRSYIDLKPTETLITSLFVDFNNDTFEDEIDIIKIAGEEHLYIVPAIFNKSNTKYERLPEIKTKISRSGSVTLQGLDIIGNHTNSFIFQAIDDNNLSIMQIYHFYKTNIDNPLEGEFQIIGDFSSDVMVFIQQIDRNEAYDFDSTSIGISFPVWIYKIDATDKSNNPGQVQQEFRYHGEKRMYELEQEIKIPASRLEAAELSKVQGGDVKVYGEFLTGLWAFGSGKSKKYIYFDYPNKEIIQVSPDIQGIFTWGQSNVRKNGIYINSVNTMITNLRRRIDVSLVSLNEIRLIIRDDVNMNIEQDTALDGYYTRQDVLTFNPRSSEQTTLSRLMEELEKGPAWVSADSTTTLSFAEHVYTLANLSGTETGLYAPISAGASDMIQFRSTSENSALDTAYRLTFGKKTLVNKRGKEYQEEDIDTIIFTPTIILGDGSNDIQKPEIVFSRVIEELQEE